jgi:hypothetical protein
MQHSRPALASRPNRRRAGPSARRFLAQFPGNMTGSTALRVLVFVLLAVIAWAVVAEPSRADRIVLRNLKIIGDRQVESLDEDGARLDDDTVLTWDEIESGTIDPAKQKEFDRLLAELGPPLFQIRQRLARGDYQGLLEPAESVYHTFASRNSPTAYQVCQAVMWGRLAAGSREQAVEPYLRCYTYRTSYGGSDAALPGDRRLTFDPITGLSPELAPVWFDAEAAKEVLPGVAKAAGDTPKPLRAAARLYYATLVATAGDVEAARTAIAGLEGDEAAVGEVRGIVLAQIEVLDGRPGAAVEQLASSINEQSAANRPLALYWLGRAQANSDDPHTRRKGVLQLLYLPALYGQKLPDLAAAGLYDAMQTLAALGDDAQSVAVRKELLLHYANSPQAKKVKADSGAASGGAGGSTGGVAEPSS